jgi:predicted site-specific integrase-resolvase
MIEPLRAARIAGVSSKIIYRWAQEGRIHYQKTQRGETLICSASLLDRIRDGEPK